MNTRQTPHQPVEPTLAVSVRRVLNSALFQASPTYSQLLSYLAAQTDVTGKKGAKAYTIALDALAQPANFDPQANALVRVQVNRLRDLLRRYYSEEGAVDPWRISIPRGSYCVQLLPAGTMDEGAIAGGSADHGPKLAVLPFVNLSGDAQQNYICDGISQEIMHLLAQSHELRLLAPDTMLHYRSRATEPVGVGRELGVDYVLGGNIRLGGETLRITAQLIDVPSDQQVWSQQYDQTLTPAKLLQVQDDIAQRIVSLLCSPHGVLQRLTRARPPSDFSVYSAVLRFYEYVEVFTPQVHASARAALEQAVAIAPAYAEAWGCLAGTYCGEYMFGFNPRGEPASILDRALTAAKRAISLAPDCVIGLYGLALTYYSRREMPLFRDAAERAVALCPNRTDVLSNLGMHLAYDGQWERGIAMLDRARSLNPLHPTWYWFPYAFDCYRRGQYEQALNYASRLNMPDFFWDPLFVAMICGQLGQQAVARAALDRTLALRPDLRTDAPAIIGIVMPTPELVNKCIEGLRKAGM